MAQVPSTSLGAAVLHMFERWSTQVFVYITTLLTATAVALILDLGYHLPPGRVLLYVLPLTLLLLFLVPAAYVVFTNTEGRNAAKLRSLLSASLDQSFLGPLTAVLRHPSTDKPDRVADLIAAINLEVERLRETTATDESRNIRQQLKDAKRNLTMIRFAQLDLRLGQSGFTPGFRAVLNEILCGLRDLAERDEASVPEHLREGFQKGVDEASAAIFDRVAVILAHQTFLANRESYPPEHEDITLSRLAEQERLWLFKQEQQP